MIPIHWQNAFMLGNQDVDTSFLTLEMTWAGMRDTMITEQIGVAVPDTFEEIVKGSTVNTYVLRAGIDAFIETAVQALHDRPKLLEDLKDNTIRTARDIRDLADTHIHHVEEYKIEKLAELLLQIRRLQSLCVAYGTVVAWADITGKISQEVVDIVNRRPNLRHPRHWYSHTLGSPESVSLTEQAKADIAASFLSEDELLKKYYWLDQGYIGTGLSRDQLRSIKHRATANTHEDTHGTVEDLKTELAPSQAEWRTFEISRAIIFMKSLRADSRQYLHVVTNRIAQRLGTRWNIDPRLVSAMSTEEIVQIIYGNQALPHNLSQRFVHSVLIPTLQGEYTVLTEPEAGQFLSQALPQESIRTSDTIRGQIAYQGKVRGTVKLLFGPQHNEKIEEGDILVSTATSPQLLSAMLRAGAFITDVGGITSHAAIVARELRKPCIVGTRYATQLLTDGMEVEVDADKGIIQILKR